MTSTTQTNLPTLAQAYAAMDGMAYRLAGVAGTVHVVKVNGMTEVEHRPTAAGRRTKTYRETRAKLGDDYTTTVTANDEVMMDLFAKAAEAIRTADLPLVG